MAMSQKYLAVNGIAAIVALGLAAGCSNGHKSHGPATTAEFAAEQTCSGYSGYKLINGQILTMDAANSMVSSVTIENDRIVAVGDDTAATKNDLCVRVIDLKGRTVVPGLIDSHIHYVRSGLVPGVAVREVESAASVRDLLGLIKAKAQTLTDGQVISVIGGFAPQQFDEKRVPTLAELDEAAADHIVYGQRGFAGPAFTNSLGKKFFTDKGVTVADDGSIARGMPTGKAFGLLKTGQTLQDQISGLQQLQSYSNSLGLTTVADQGGVPFPGAGYFDPTRDYAALQELWRNDGLTVRVRAQRLSYDGEEKPGKVEEFLNNAWSRLGDDYLKVTALGEHIVTFPRKGEVNSAYAGKIKNIAEKGWSHEQHSTSAMENRQHIAAIEAAHALHPINDLRWSLTHVFEIGHQGDLTEIEKLKSWGMGLRLQNHAYSAPTDKFPLGRTLGGANAGPLYRTLIDSGIKLGAGTDGPLLGPMNPWLSIYYMVTGKNSAGELVNGNQTLSRMEALSLYTRENAWFTFDEDDIGSLEPGKKADLVVLNADYLTVSDEDIRRLGAVLTMVDGKIVYSEWAEDVAK